MQKKDFFVGYNKDNKDWAKWIAGTLEENNYTVYLQAWDIAPGDDFIARMNEFLESSMSYIAVWSDSFSKSEYCKKEFQTAFNRKLTNSLELFLPVRVEDIPLGSLYSTTVYTDLFDLDEEQAKKTLLNAVGHTPNPRKKGKFPNSDKKETCSNGADSNALKFPGNLSGSSKIRDIIILEKDGNKKGDLFNRMSYDVLHALGFSQPSYNVQKSGREIDIVLQHRTEKRIALVESKAINEKVGGNYINKFAGVLDVERGAFEKGGNTVVGYFISRSGFTSTALLQEKERSKNNTANKIILLGPDEITQELIQGRVICSLIQAASAVKLPEKQTLVICDYADLLVCDQGWIWVLYYSEYPNQAASHFAFVHADGNQLISNVADELLQQAKALNKDFSKLTYINSISKDISDKAFAKAAYFEYLANELGEIQFEGMPTDKEAGSVKVDLENLFVPLCFNYDEADELSGDTESEKATIRQVLEDSQRAAILAKPGGGKSTLIRRMALAYAYPERRKMVDDELPEREWFPIYIRCRDLRADANRSILEIIHSIVIRAEIHKYENAFKDLVADALQDGRVLLLIDGLDEISAEQHRICFVNQLRTFIATYPSVHLIITSRETGFRAVAGTITSYCKQYTIANLDENQIRSLSLKWHEAILDNTQQAKIDSEKVCGIILDDPRITELAKNPLLLTTLLFVKRWIGYLPTKRCQLYEEMIKLLLVTWNAAAHIGLDLDETEPQLAFVAHYMTTKGEQKITRDQLERCIIEARKALPEILSYTKISPAQFIDQVEERSSLLIQQGLEENERGILVPSYEFSHLSFQEYLTAKAIIECWIPETAEQTLLETLENHMTETQWQEVIPLAAVLAGRQAKSSIEYLLEKGESITAKKGRDRKSYTPNAPAVHLANCIASEVPMSQENLDKSIFLTVKNKKNIRRAIITKYSTSINVFQTILNSKYGPRYREIIEKELFDSLNYDYIFDFSDAWISIYTDDNGLAELPDIYRLISSSGRKDNITGALLLMQFSFDLNKKGKTNHKKYADKNLLSVIFTELEKLLQSDDLLGIFSAAWCIAWAGYAQRNIIPTECTQQLFDKLVQIWISLELPYEIRRVVSWALCTICTTEIKIDCTPELEKAVSVFSANPLNGYDIYTSICLAALSGVWSREEVRLQLKSARKKHSIPNPRFFRDLGYKNIPLYHDIF